MHTLHLPDHDALLRWYDLPGQGRALVCLPALSFPAAANFAQTVAEPALAASRRILIDTPGSGTSTPARTFDYSPRAHARIVARLLDHLALGPAVIFGHSMGGCVAMYLALDRPDLVAHVAVGEGNLTPGGGPASRSIARQPLQDFVDHGFAALIAGHRQGATQGDATAAYLHGLFQHADPAVLHANATGLVQLPANLAPAFLALDLPRSFIYGAHSLAQNLPAPDVPDPDLLARHGIAIEIVPDAGHLMTRDNPAALAAILAKILAA